MILKTSHTTESHTAEHLATFVNDLVENLGIKKIMPLTITTDNAKNIVKGVKDAGYLNIG